MPQPPEWLDEDELAIWNKGARWMVNIGLLTVADEFAFGMICECAVRYLKTKEALGKMSAEDLVTHATMMKTKDGNAIQNPMVGALNVLRRDLTRMLAEFGLTPSSRSQIGVDTEPADPIMRKYGLTG